MNKSILDVVHHSAKGLYDAGLMDVQTMNTFDAVCLPPAHKLSPRPKKHRARSPLKLLHLVANKILAAISL